MNVSIIIEGKFETMLERIMVTTGKNKSDAIRLSIETMFNQISAPDKVGYDELMNLGLTLLEVLCRIDSRIHIETVYKKSGKYESAELTELLNRVKEEAEKMCIGYTKQLQEK